MSERARLRVHILKKTLGDGTDEKWGVIEKREIGSREEESGRVRNAEVLLKAQCHG